MPEEKWECRKDCGACCEILPPLVWGHKCELYDKETKKCMDYENRPEICRVYPENVKKKGDAVYIQACDDLREKQKKKG